MTGNAKNKKGKRVVQILIPVIILMMVGAVIYYIYFAVPKKPDLVLATTTSVNDSGLLDRILPNFESKYNIKVKVLAVGSGQALAYGRSGDADVLFVHSPTDENEFVKNGYGLYRKTLLWNTYMIIGPKDTNPAALTGIDKAKGAFQKIYDTNSTFISRADDSGTNKKELGIWKSCNISQSKLNTSSWYLRNGMGMGDTLIMTNEKSAYTITDEGTWYSMEGKLGKLKVYVDNDTALLNYYSVIPVNASMHSNINSDGATKFVDWLFSPETLNMVADYRVNGHQLFRIYTG